MTELVFAFAYFLVCAGLLVWVLADRRRRRARFDHLRANHIEQVTDPGGFTYLDVAMRNALRRDQQAPTPAAPAPLPVWPPAQAPLPPVVMPKCTCRRQVGVAHVCRRSS